MVPPWVTYVLMGVGISGLVIAAITLGVNLCLRHRDKPEKELEQLRGTLEFHERQVKDAIKTFRRDYPKKNSIAEYENRKRQAYKDFNGESDEAVNDLNRIKSEYENYIATLKEIFRDLESKRTALYQGPAQRVHGPPSTLRILHQPSTPSVPDQPSTPSVPDQPSTSRDPNRLSTQRVSGQPSTPRLSSQQPTSSLRSQEPFYSARQEQNDEDIELQEATNVSSRV